VPANLYRPRSREHDEDDNKAGLDPVAVNTALTIGPVIFGPVGDDTRLESTIIGEPVNLAAKLDKHNKKLGTRALATQDAFAMALAQGNYPKASRETRCACRVDNTYSLCRAAFHRSDFGEGLVERGGRVRRVGRRRLGDPERGDHAVAEELVVRATVLLDDRGQPRLILCQERHDLVGSELIGERREAADIKDEKGAFASLATPNADLVFGIANAGRDPGSKKRDISCTALGSATKRIRSLCAREISLIAAQFRFRLARPITGIMIVTTNIITRNNAVFQPHGIGAM
jgi:hypothetical protein